MAKKLIEHLENENWDEASRALKRIKSLKTLSEALDAVAKLPSVTPAMIQRIYSKAKALYDDEPTKNPYSLRQFSSFYRLSALFRLAPIETLRVLLNEMAGVSQTFGADPVLYDVRDIINNVWEKYLTGALELGARSVKTTSRDALLSVSTVADLDGKPELQLLWRRTVLLLRAAEKRDVSSPYEDGEDWLTAHAIIKRKCPTIVLWFALKLYPSQIRTRDASGNLPLHYGAKNFPCVDRFDHVEFPQDLQEAKMSPILFLMSRFPEGARYADGEGRLPLGIVLKNYRFYGHEPEDIMPILEGLVTAASQSLVTRDPVTRFYPYQDAASNDDVGLDIIYMLLVSNPTSLNHRTLSTTETENEKLLKENIGLREQNKQLGDQNGRLQQQIEKLQEELNQSRQEIQRLKREPGSCAEADSTDRKRPRSS